MGLFQIIIRCCFVSWSSSSGSRRTWNPCHFEDLFWCISMVYGSMILLIYYESLNEKILQKPSEQKEVAEPFSRFLHALYLYFHI